MAGNWRVGEFKDRGASYLVGSVFCSQGPRFSHCFCNGTRSVGGEVTLKQIC